jgi:Lrp/AsnC family transcriptional regulator, regulator for asnA, asnC and gidA
LNIDNLTKTIIKLLKDGRKSYKEIAKDLSVAENTVRSRVKKMLDEGFLEISGLIDPGKLTGHMVVVVGVKLKGMDGVKKGEEMSKLKGVISVCAVTGRYDLFLLACLNESFGLAEFITHELDSVEDIQSAETFVVYKSFNLKVPYNLD